METYEDTQVSLKNLGFLHINLKLVESWFYNSLADYFNQKYSSLCQLLKALEQQLQLFEECTLHSSANNLCTTVKSPCKQTHAPRTSSLYLHSSDSKKCYG
jgi:hypothetical protein